MESSRKFGTAPVFFTAIATILGAILFLRFGFAVGTLGFWGVILVILLGHLVTIPTALALSEIATNKRVEGGGEYFIISRSFGLNIGATIGAALYLSQAISVAFYVIAFTESFQFFFQYMQEGHGIALPRQAVSIPALILLSVIILTKGANLGVKTLYFVVALLFITLILFFLGGTQHGETTSFGLENAELRNFDSFFMVFAIIFPAFTGMTAGVGLSGDLKKPRRAIPLGTTAATLSGMVIYFFIAYKMSSSASIENLVNNQFVMGDIAIAGYIIIPLGLAASTISSALGSVMVAPRTLQALASDRSIPGSGVNNYLAKGRKKDNEPFNASVVTLLIALVFVALGNVNAVAEIISMFFMLTYGSLCLISFLNHFGASPSYRPSFKTHWLVSLIGFITSIWVMFKINLPYAVAAVIIMTVLFLYMNHYHKGRKGLASIFTNSIFQINRKIQLYMQRKKGGDIFSEWRPSAICISDATFERDNALKLMEWVSYKYGFASYLHRFEGYYSRKSKQESDKIYRSLITNIERNNIYMNVIISPSYTSAIAQAIQIPGFAGMENNMVIFEFDKETPDDLPDIIDNFNLVTSGEFDVCILAGSRKPKFYKNGIHVWIKTTDTHNANLMILLSYIIMGHPDWENANLKIIEICSKDNVENVMKEMRKLVNEGRLPISMKNIEILIQEDNKPTEEIINEYSQNIPLTILGFRKERVKHEKENVFTKYPDLNDILFVNSHDKKDID
jgi:amino acid transporter